MSLTKVYGFSSWKAYSLGLPYYQHLPRWPYEPAGILKEIMNIPWEALTALLLYIIASTIGFVWWMATQTITLQFVREDLQNANKLLGALESLSVTKPEFAKEVARFELSIQAAHRRIDEINNKHGG